MKIFKFDQYITEGIVNDAPEEVIHQALTVVKRNIDRMFAEGNDSVDTFNDSNNKSRKKEGGMSFADMGLELQSSELTRYSKLNDSVKVIFSDEHSRYDLIIIIDLASAIPEEADTTFNMDSIEDCTVKFKKYTDSALVGQFTKKVPLKDISEELLIDLKIELDQMFGDDESEEEDFSIEIE